MEVMFIIMGFSAAMLMAIYVFLFCMLGLLGVGLLVPAYYITIPKDDENEMK